MKTNTILSIAAALLCTSAAWAQKTGTYDVSVGDRSSRATFEYSSHDGLSRMVQTYGNRVIIQDNDSNMNTVYMKVTDKDRKIDAEIKAQGGKLVMTGTMDGEKVNKSYDMKGNPWFQHIGIVAGYVLKDGSKKVFCCVRPDELSFQTMQANLEGAEDFHGWKSTKIKVSPTGAAALFWSCNYWFETSSKVMTGYRAVEGGPGTPTTTWVLRK